jgi:hypothetical protein
MRTLVFALAFLFATEEALQLLNPDAKPRDANVARWSAGGRDLWVAAGIYDDELIAAVLREESDGEYSFVACTWRKCHPALQRGIPCLARIGRSRVVSATREDTRPAVSS